MTQKNSGFVTIGNPDDPVRVLDLRGWLPGTETYDKRELWQLAEGESLKWLVVHHTAGGYLKSGRPRDYSAREIARYHTAPGNEDGTGGLDWPGIGYHFLIHENGGMEYVGDILTIRYNVARQNDKVIGICLSGNFTRHWPPPKQLAATKKLLANLQYALGWAVPIMGHREIALPGFGTSCPGDTFLEGPRWKDALLP